MCLRYDLLPLDVNERRCRPHPQTLLSELPQLRLVPAVLTLQVSLSPLGLSTQRLHLQHQDPPLSGQHQQLPLGTLRLAGGMDGAIK